MRAIFRRQRNLAFREGRVLAVEMADRVVQVSGGGRLPFDYLVLTAGATSSDFGVPGVREHALFLKTLTEAVNLRSHVLEQFARAARDPAALLDWAHNHLTWERHTRLITPMVPSPGDAADGNVRSRPMSGGGAEQNGPETRT